MSKATPEQIKIWYNYTPVLYEIVKTTGNREVGFITFKEGEQSKVSRGYKIAYKDMLQNTFKVIGFFRKPTNIYSSVAKVLNIPTFTYNFRERAKSMEDFNVDFDKYVTDYDLLIDFDPEGKILPESTIQQAIETAQLLNKYGITYSIRTSGKGIHLYVDGDQFKQYNKFDKPKLYKEITFNLKNIMGFTQVDETLYTEDKICRRYCKTPYTMDVKTANICLPITFEQLKQFKKEQANMEYVFKNTKIYKREIPLTNIDKKTKSQQFIEAIQPD